MITLSWPRQFTHCLSYSKCVIIALDKCLELNKINVIFASLTFRPTQIHFLLLLLTNINRLFQNALEDPALSFYKKWFLDTELGVDEVKGYNSWGIVTFVREKVKAKRLKKGEEVCASSSKDQGGSWPEMPRRATKYICLMGPLRQELKNL